MRRHHVWYLLAAFWGADALLGFMRRHTQQALLAACFGLCFLGAGVFFRRREQNREPQGPRG